jgi:putative FmdB family regulatory protein
MPIYEYRCEQGHTFEVMQRITDDPLSSCQTCSAPVQRIFHPVAVHFKGSGFYSTDYGSRKRAREGSDGADGAGKDGASGSDAGSKSSQDGKSSAGSAKDSTARKASSSSSSD